MELVPLRQFVDERGAVLHMLRADSALLPRFGEIYFSLVNPGVVKGWKRHFRMTQHFAVPVGRLRVVLVDDRNPATPPLVEEVILGRPDRYCLLQIPPGVWYGFQSVSAEPALVANCTDMVHDPAESETRDLDKGPLSFDWRYECPK
ncbi:MAG TPA: dTDP-4-dehydrorhamnose 3,5-epimerase [Candidatus Ozemobacteraceae bacterium]